MVLANPFKEVLPSIISVNQGPMWKGRQILDEFIVTNELIHCKKKAKIEGIALKNYLEKDYDHML